MAKYRTEYYLEDKKLARCALALVDDGHQYKTHRVVLDVIRPGHTISENALTSTIRDNTGSSLSTDDTWIIGSTWSRGFSGVHKMFMKPESISCQKKIFGNQK